MAEELNIETIKESGVLELYVAGALPPDEQARIHQFVQQHPELQQEVQAIEDTFLTVASTWAPSNAGNTGLVQALRAIETEQNQHVAETQPTATIKPMRTLRVWAVAASILLASSVVVNYFFYQQIRTIQTENQALVTRLQDNETKLAVANQLIEHISSEESQLIPLEGLPAYPGASGLIAYNPQNRLIALQQLNLPDIEQAYDFQLWYIGAEGPVDAGLITDAESITQLRILEGDAHAFAITIEPKGGSQSPTLDKMVVLGKVA